MVFNIGIWKVQLVDLHLAKEWCVLSSLSARTIDVRKGKGVFVETALTNFKTMYEVCDLHAAREYHKIPLLSVMLL